MGNIHDAFPSAYLKASDLKGTQPVVTMDRVEYEEVGQKKDRKPILYFVGKTKGLVLNKTNCNRIVELTGTPITEEWQGQQIQLFMAHVEFQGDTVEAIRVKAPPKAKLVKAPPPPVVDEEFVTADDDGDPVPF